MEKLTTIEQFKELLNLSSKNNLIIYKHSSACPVSHAAQARILNLLQEKPLIIYEILVIEDRPLSNYIAEVLSIKHQSPQILLIKNQECFWNASHLKVNEENIKQALKDL